MDAQAREKMLARLKKCFALGNSPEPHEAAAAMRQAQKIIQELGLSKADVANLDGPTVVEVVIKTREGFGKCYTLSYLIAIVKETFGVHALCVRNPGSANRMNVHYIGPEGRVKLAEYAHKVVWQAMQRSWETYLNQNPELKGLSGKRQSFHTGWLAKVAAQVQGLAATEAEREAINRWIKASYGDVPPMGEIKEKELDPNAYWSGVQSAKGFTLNRPVEARPLGITQKGA